jgi:hypothetical protein
MSAPRFKVGDEVIIYRWNQFEMPKLAKVERVTPKGTKVYAGGVIFDDMGNSWRGAYGSPCLYPFSQQVFENYMHATMETIVRRRAYETWPEEDRAALIALCEKNEAKT